MANHQSAKKRARQDIKRNHRNKSYLSSVRTHVKKFRQSLEEFSTGNATHDQVKEMFCQAQSALGKSSKKGLLHKNCASRRIGRLAQAMQAAVSKK